jgi:hypothetical protein
MLKSLILEPGLIEQLGEEEAAIIGKFPSLASCKFEEICGDLETPDEGGCKKGCICGVII